MNIQLRKLETLLLILSLILILNLTASIPFGLSASGIVTVNLSSVVCQNALSYGFQLDTPDIAYWKGSTTAQQYADTNNYKLVRFFYHRLGQPCTSWNHGSLTGSFSWTAIDDLVNKIFAVGAQPLIVLGFASSSGITGLPSGMPTRSDGLPEYADWAAYCQDWVDHFKATSKPVVYYEIVNEPHAYFGWGGTNTARRNSFAALYNAAYTAMKASLSTIKISNDNFMVSASGLSTYMAANCQVDYLSWHSYLCGNTGVSDATVINNAYTDEGGEFGSANFIEPARTVWHTAKGVWYDVIMSEGNLDYQWSSGQDSRMRTIINSVCEALRTRLYILNTHVKYSVYFHFAHSNNGYFGMVNTGTNTRYPPYWTHNIIWSDSNGLLSVGDNIYTSSSSIGDIVTLAWKHGATTLLLIINKSTSSNTITISGIPSGTYTYFSQTSSTSSYTTGSIGMPVSITLNGYTVYMLKQSSTTDNPPTWLGVDSTQYNTTIGGQKCNFSTVFQDDIALSKSIFSCNNTGVWANSTKQSLTGTTDTATNTITLNATASQVFFKWFCNDSANQWTQTLFGHLILSSVSDIPQWTQASASTTIVSSYAFFNSRWTDLDGLSGYIFGTNNTGHWVNNTWYDPWSPGTPTSGSTPLYTYLNDTVGVYIHWQIWVNDTLGNWGSTDEFIFVTTASGPFTVLTYETYEKPTGYLMYGTNFSICVPTGLGLGFQGDDLYVKLTTASGTLWGENASLFAHTTDGICTFTSVNTSTVTFDFIACSVRVDGTEIKANQTLSLALGSHVVEWYRIIKPLVPITFLLGIVGLVALFSGPTYTVYKMKHHEYYDGLVSGIVVTSIGFGLTLAWLFLP